MTTRSKYVRGMLEFYDDSTQERVLPVAPVLWEDDFIGYQLRTSESGSTGDWLTVEVGNATVTAGADTANGAAVLALTATSEAQDAVLYMGDNKNFNTKAKASVEFRVNVSVLPTTGVACVFGLAGDHNLDKDTITEGAWFRMQASGAVLAETDDTTNNNDDVSTGHTAVAGTYDVYRIDFHDLTDVRFYINGDHVATGTTFDMSNLSDAEAVMQPYMSIDKASGTGVGTIAVDYVRVWSARSA